MCMSRSNCRIWASVGANPRESNSLFTGITYYLNIYSSYQKLHLLLRYVKSFSEGSLLRNIDPVPGSSYHSLSIDSSKTKGVADSETCTISDPQITIFIIFRQYIRVGCVYNQVLHVSPCQVITLYTRIRAIDWVMQKWQLYQKQKLHTNSSMQ